MGKCLGVFPFTRKPVHKCWCIFIHNPPNWAPPKYPSTSEWKPTMVHPYTVIVLSKKRKRKKEQTTDVCSNRRRNLTCTLLSERSQSQRAVWFHLLWKRQNRQKTDSWMPRAAGEWIDYIGVPGDFWGWWNCSIHWLWWWFYNCMHLSKLIELYTTKKGTFYCM